MNDPTPPEEESVPVEVKRPTDPNPLQPLHWNPPTASTTRRRPRFVGQPLQRSKYANENDYGSPSFERDLRLLSPHIQAWVSPGKVKGFQNPPKPSNQVVQMQGRPAMGVRYRVYSDGSFRKIVDDVRK